jgi:hypothetical protein
MKKILALVFAWLYVFTLSGVTLNFHYCGETLNCISLFTPDDCCTCADNEEPGCCNDEGVYLKATDDSHTTCYYYDFAFSTASVGEPLRFALKKSSREVFRMVPTYHAYDLPPPQRIILFRRLLI